MQEEAATCYEAVGLEKHPTIKEVQRRVHPAETFDSDKTLKVNTNEVVGAESSSKSKFVVTPKINGRLVSMEVDTFAEVTFGSCSVYNELCRFL